MVKSRASRGILLTSNLPQLQNLIKRDPAGYKEEFLVQWAHYTSLLRLFQSVPTLSSSSAGGAGDDTGNTTATFRDLVGFVAQVAVCYPVETRGFAGDLSRLLLEGGGRGLGNDTRKTLVMNLVMLRNKDVITSIELLQTLFPLLPLTTSPSLRSFIRRTILTDIKTANTPHKNHKLNRVVQSLLFGMVERGMSAEVVGDRGGASAKRLGEEKGGGAGEAMWAVTFIKELWKKSVWNDAKTVAIATRACAHPSVKVQSAGIHFFLGVEDEEEESESEDEGPDLKKLTRQRIVKKKTKADDRRLQKAVATSNKKRKEKAAKEGTKVNFPALDLLHDPQRFGEDLYENLHKHDKQYSLEHKVLIMQLLSRVMGAHKLCVLGFYSYVIKYLTYHQLRVTQILVALAQSVHDLTPPDVLTPVIHKLAHEFVHPGVGAEVIAAGINSIREVSRRQPWCMEGEEDLLADLIEYRKSKDKGVTTAARGLLQLFREVNPGLLKRRERGKAASMGQVEQAPAFGSTKEAADGIEGLELLEEHFAAARREQDLDSDASLDEAAQEEVDAAGWDNWEVESESGSDSSSGWEEVSEDEERGIEWSDSDDDDEEKERRKKAKGKGRGKDEPVDEEDEVDTKSEAATDMSEGKKLSLMAQQKILTPADFALLNDLRLKAAQTAAEQGGGTAAKRKVAELEARKKANVNIGSANEAFLDEGDIMGPRKKAKQDYEERMASIQKGREGREKYGSVKSKKAALSSTTNREKKKNKPIMMHLHSDKVVQKKKASLRDKQIRLRNAIEKQRKSKY